MGYEEKAIVITIPAFGAPKVEAVGFNGMGCTDATAVFEQALSNGAVENRDFKPEWSNPNEESEQESQSW